MALTVVDPPWGRATDAPMQKRRTLEVDFDDDYALGGEAFDYRNYGIADLIAVMVEGQKGYTFEYDKTNYKLKVLAPAPPIVHEEYVVVTDNVGYLKYPAAHINYIATGTSTPTPSSYSIPIAGGVTPATKQCAVDMGYNDTTGVLTKGQRTTLTFLAADAITHCYVSYATQAWKELTDNMEMAKVTGVGADEGLKVYGNSGMATDPVVDADILRLGVDVVAVQSITWSDGGDAGTIKVPELLKDGGTPAATLEMEIDFAKTTTFAEIVCNANDMCEMVAGDIIRVVYIKNPGVGGAATSFLDRRFTNAEIAVAADTITFTGTPLIYGSCGQIPCATSDDKAYLVATADTVASNEAHWTTHPWGHAPAYGAPILTEEASTDDNLSPAWINGNPSELTVVPLEVPNGDDLSDITGLRVVFIGN